jgi:rhodanese-related sulfurtransferase
MAQPLASPRSLKPVLAALALVGFVLPVAVYWFAVGQAPSLTPQEAKRLLSAPGARAVLVDVRAPDVFDASHLAGARNWPLASITALTSAGGMPADLRGRQLLLFCDNGISSARAALKLRSLGVGNAAALRDGLAGWIASEAGGMGEPGALCRLVTAGGANGPLPARASPVLEQWAAVLTGFAVKPFAMLLSLVLVLWLWRSRSADLAALRWAMLAFFVGEGACAANYLFFQHQSHFTEFLHSYGMLLTFGLVAYAAMEGMDSRIFHFSDPERRCAALPLCGACIKSERVPCQLERVFLLAILCTAAVGLMPLFAQPQMVSYNTVIWGVPYNYSRPVLYQVFETRFCPLGGLLVLCASFVVLLVWRRACIPASKALFAAGLGTVGFGLFRFFIFRAYHGDLAWFAFWEEITEAILVAGVALVLWFFARTLFRRAGSDTPT